MNAIWCYIHPAAQMPSLGTLQKPHLQLRTKNMQQQANVTIVGRMSMIANVVPDPSKYALKCEQSSDLCDITRTFLVNKKMSPPGSPFALHPAILKYSDLL